jgi:hypothetical protein
MYLIFNACDKPSLEHKVPGGIFFCLCLSLIFIEEKLVVICCSYYQIGSFAKDKKDSLQLVRVTQIEDLESFLAVSKAKGAARFHRAQNGS